MKSYKIIPVIAFLTALSCISPLDIETEQNERILVVEGFISTGPGPYTIRLTKSARYGSVFEGVVRNETGADVWIKDQEGTTTFLFDQENGLYNTPPDFRGKVGSTYTLNIRTVDGTIYASLPETITPVPTLDSLFYIFKKIPTSDPFDFTSGIEVYGVWQDPLEETNFYTWRNKGVYFIETHPELFVSVGPFGRAPAPKPCCAECWVGEENADYSVLIHKDNNSNGMVNTQLVAFIEDDGGRFMDKYQVRIQQLSISKEAYQFFNLLKNQISINGDIFDPPPATVRGNIINLDNPDNNVIGYFHASDVSEISGFIDRSMLEETQKARQFNDDCRVLKGATTIKPNDWD